MKKGKAIAPCGSPAGIKSFLRISKESIFTGLSNLKADSIVDTRFSKYFGFTDEDVDKLLQYYELFDFKNTIKEWYDGYLFGETNIYCPWDVICYCDALCSNKKTSPRNYWANTSGNGLVKQVIDRSNRRIKDDLETLLAGGQYNKTDRVRNDI